MMPNAGTVSLNLESESGAIEMVKDAHGVWSVTVPKLAPEYYAYYFTVDGVDLPDPENPTRSDTRSQERSMFLLPGKPAMPWEPRNVPHGAVHHHLYYSQIVATNSEYYVYTPPGFDANSQRKYPVLYLLHGFDDSPNAWIEMGKVNVILDNMIAAGRVKPMIVVMPLSFGDTHIIPQGLLSLWRQPSVHGMLACPTEDAPHCLVRRVSALPRVITDLAQRTEFTVLRHLRGETLVKSNYRNFDKVLFEEVMPSVARQYPISDQRDERAIAGISMGGAETLLVGLNHSDEFAWAGSFSAAGGIDEDYFDGLFPAISSQSARTQPKLKLLWIACGTDDGLFDYNESFIAWLKEQGLQPTAVITPGLHDWPVWRDNFVQFAPLLFQSKS